LIPYAVNAPLWSDGADKQRYVALPDGASMQVEANGSFELPPGGVLIKEFGERALLLETRFLVRTVDGTWRATTYAWNAEQTEAFRSREGVSIERDAGAWSVPTEEQCFECHTDAAGISLGLEQRQMDLSLEYPGTGRTAEQIHTLTQLGLLHGESADEPLVSPLDPNAELEQRARAYLHANCSHCHRPGGLGEGELDLRAATPFELTKTCEHLPLTADPVPGGGFILAPGDPENSALYLRMTTTDPTWRMPPIGSEQVDTEASELLFEWIASLRSCP
jgi:uncharacterized repeat protein (TIGR03806 family)